MPENSPTLQTAIGFVLSHATDDDLNRLFDAIKQRRAALGAIRAATLTVGTKVKIGKLTPKYLNDLIGTITAIDGKRATVTLDETSTDLLRFTKQNRFVVPPGSTSYGVPGVPLACCLPTG